MMAPLPFLNLRLRRTKLLVEAPGFKTATVDHIQVAVQMTRRTDVKLEVGAIGESVIVSSEAIPVLQTESPVQQTNITEKQVRELPLQIGGETAGRSPLVVHLSRQQRCLSGRQCC